MRLYRKYLSIQAKSALEYRTNLIFGMISSSLHTIVTFFGILLVFEKFKTIAGYTLNDILITYSMICFTFAVAECFFRGFDQFDGLVASGELDRLLIRPRSIFIQVLGYKTEFNKIGRAVFCAGILIYALVTSSIEWTVMKVFVVLLMCFGAILIFFSMFLLYAGVSIFTVEGIEVMNVFTNGGRDLSEYPINIFPKVFKVVFTYIIPFGCVNYLPLMYLLGRSNSLLYALSPLFVILFFVLCYLFFRWALTKYKSTGS